MITPCARSQLYDGYVCGTYTRKIPDTTDEEALTSAEVDWSRDTARWGGRMTEEAFASSMFELADIWTENIDEEEVRSNDTV